MDHAEQLYQRVLEKNTFYFYASKDKYDWRDIGKLTCTLMNLYYRIGASEVKREYFDDVLRKESGLRAILALNGFSFSSLKRVIQLALESENESLGKLLNRPDWNYDDVAFISRTTLWSSRRIKRMVREDPAFRAGIVNLLFEGATNPCLIEFLPPREITKLSIQKLNFETSSLVETLVIYRLFTELVQEVTFHDSEW